MPYIIAALIIGILIMLNWLVKADEMVFDENGHFTGWKKSPYKNLFDYLVQNLNIR